MAGFGLGVATAQTAFGAFEADVLGIGKAHGTSLSNRLDFAA